MTARSAAPWRRPLRAAPFLALVLLGAAAFGPAPAGLSVREADGRWTRWAWTGEEGRGAERSAADADVAPRPAADAMAPGGSAVEPATPLLDRARWSATAPGVEHVTLAVSAGGPAAAVELVVARVTPDSVRFALAWDRDPADGRPRWDLDRAPDDALVALNAGMFLGTVPWGWVRLDGADRLLPGRGPLSSALAIDAAGRIHWVDGDDLTALRARRDITLAFQSYPTLLTGQGVIPAALREGALIDRAHRDIRLGLGLDAAGRLLVVLTRCTLPFPAADRLPLGLTVPEMAQVMGALGARQAMLLDGGLSAQLQLRDATGVVRRWEGLRKVPLALIARGRAGAAALAQRSTPGS